MSATIATPQPKVAKKQPLTIAEAFQFASVTDLEKDSRRGVEVIIVRVEYKGETHLAEHFVILQDDADEFVFQMYKEVGLEKGFDYTELEPVRFVPLVEGVSQDP